MNILWNQLTLERPPTTTWDLTSNNFPTKSFLKLLHKIYNAIHSQNMLNKEAALLSRLIYRMKQKFRHDKGLKNLEKINRALLNYLRISLENEYKYLIDNTTITKNLTKLPTKQMLQYVLTRTQGFSMLLSRIEQVSMQAARFFKMRIELGHSWTISILIYSVISRIWMLSRHIIKKCCIWYNQLFPFLSQLNQVGVNWLPENYQLPSDLTNWLSIPWIEEPIQSLYANNNSVDAIFNLINHQNASDDELDSILEIKANENEDNSINTITNKEMFHVSNDIGVPISRNSLAFDVTKASEISKMAKKIVITTVVTENDLHQLLTLDSYPGLDKLQWKIIKNIINKNLLRISKSKDRKKRNIILKKINKILHAYIDGQK